MESKHSENVSKIKHVISQKAFKRPMTFQVLNISQDPLDPPMQFTVTLDIVIDGFLVFIKLPALNFELPSDGGYLVTAAGYLPPNITPDDSVYASSTLESDQTGPGYDVYIANDGSIRVLAKAMLPSHQADLRLLMPKLLLTCYPSVAPSLPLIFYSVTAPLKLPLRDLDLLVVNFWISILLISSITDLPVVGLTTLESLHLPSSLMS